MQLGGPSGAWLLMSGHLTPCHLGHNDSWVVLSFLEMEFSLLNKKPRGSDAQRSIGIGSGHQLLF